MLSTWSLRVTSCPWGEVYLTIPLGVLGTQSHTPSPQPSGVGGTVTSPYSTGVTVVPTLVDGTLGRDDVRLDTMTDVGGDQHLDCLHGHLDDVTVRE